MKRERTNMPKGPKTGTSIRLSALAKALLKLERGKTSEGAFVEQLILANVKTSDGKKLVAEYLKQDEKLTALAAAAGIKLPFNTPWPPTKSNAIAPAPCNGIAGGEQHNNGAVAQLAERVNGIHEVTGSTPVSSTTQPKKRKGKVVVIPLGPKAPVMVMVDGTPHGPMTRKQLAEQFPGSHEEKSLAE